jgi:hypothetical protein
MNPLLHIWPVHTFSWSLNFIQTTLDSIRLYHYITHSTYITMISVTQFSLGFAGHVSQTGLRRGLRVGGRASVVLPRGWIRARRRGFASLKTNGVEGGDDRLPLAGLKVLDMTRVLAGVRFFCFYSRLLAFRSES